MNSALSQSGCSGSSVAWRPPLALENGLKGLKQSRSRGAQFIVMRNGKRSEKLVGTTRQAKIYFSGVALAR